MMGDQALTDLSEEVANGVTPKRKREIELEIERVKVADAVADFQMVVLAGGSEYVGIGEDATRLMEVASEAQYLHDFHDAKGQPDFVDLVVHLGGQQLDNALRAPPDLQPRLNRDVAASRKALSGRILRTGRSVVQGPDSPRLHGDAVKERPRGAGRSVYCRV